MPGVWAGLLVLGLLLLVAFIWQLRALDPAVPASGSAARPPAPISLRAPESEALERTREALEQLELEARERAARRSLQSMQADPAASSERPARSAATPRPVADAPASSGIRERVEPILLSGDPTAQDVQAEQPELCAGLSVFARARCLQDACDTPEWAEHPQCVDLRARQQSLQSGAGDH